MHVAVKWWGSFNPTNRRISNSLTLLFTLWSDFWNAALILSSQLCLSFFLLWWFFFLHTWQCILIIDQLTSPWATAVTSSIHFLHKSIMYSMTGIYLTLLSIHAAKWTTTLFGPNDLKMHLLPWFWLAAEISNTTSLSQWENVDTISVPQLVQILVDVFPLIHFVVL